MPRIKEDTTDSEVTVPVEDGSAPKAARAPRRTPPEGVTVGVLDAPVPVDAPPARAGRGGGGGRGRSVSQSTLDMVETLKSHPGQWYKIGTFMTSIAPGKTTELGRHGFQFSHSDNGNGTFDRFASLPVPPEMQNTPAEG